MSAWAKLLVKEEERECRLREVIAEAPNFELVEACVQDAIFSEYPAVRAKAAIAGAQSCPEIYLPIFERMIERDYVPSVRARLAASLGAQPERFDRAQQPPNVLVRAYLWDPSSWVNETARETLVRIYRRPEDTAIFPDEREAAWFEEELAKPPLDQRIRRWVVTAGGDALFGLLSRSQLTLSEVADCSRVSPPAVVAQLLREGAGSSATRDTAQLTLSKLLLEASADVRITNPLHWALFAWRYSFDMAHCESERVCSLAIDLEADSGATQATIEDAFAKSVWD